ncbi:MAG: hypothetical protein ABSF71_28500, partial [Terriglobia bacterium]
IKTPCPKGRFPQRGARGRGGRLGGHGGSERRVDLARERRETKAVPISEPAWDSMALRPLLEFLNSVTL